MQHKHTHGALTCIYIKATYTYYAGFMRSRRVLWNRKTVLEFEFQILRVQIFFFVPIRFAQQLLLKLIFTVAET